MFYIFNFSVWEWAPYMPSDIQWFVQELAMFLTQAVEYIQTHRHKYSARYYADFLIDSIERTLSMTLVLLEVTNLIFEIIQ